MLHRQRLGGDPLLPPHFQRRGAAIGLPLIISGSSLETVGYVIAWGYLRYAPHQAFVPVLYVYMISKDNNCTTIRENNIHCARALLFFDCVSSPFLLLRLSSFWKTFPAIIQKWLSNNHYLKIKQMQVTLKAKKVNQDR
jgi:hypothetical protein